MPDWFPRSAADWVAFTPVRIVFILLIMGLLNLILRQVINRLARNALSGRFGWSRLGVPRKLGEQLTKATALHKERRHQRISALKSLGKSVVTVGLMIITLVMILSELGFDVTTVIAGTSLVGVTLAFGFQNVIKDFMSGIFMLIEDQLGVGDVVDMELGAGTVEAVGLRVTQLRIADGTVIFVRNGEVTRVRNYSQGGPGELPPDPPPTLSPPDFDQNS